MEDKDKEKTIVRFDFVGSKRITDFLDRYSGEEGIKGFLKKITSLREESLKKVIPVQNHRNNIVLRTEGDAAYLIFENADHAYLFAEEFLKNSNKEKFQFRIGAATGDIGTIKVRNLEDSEPFKLEEHILLMKSFFESISEELKEKFSPIFEAYNKLLEDHNSLQQKFDSETIGKALSDAVRLEVYGSKPGGFCIDYKTYQEFSQGIKNQNKFNQISVKGKNGEEAITAWYYQIITEETQPNIKPDDVVKTLQLLNYKNPENKFTELMNRKTVAVIIQGRNEQIQNWLIHRLLHKVPSYSINKKSGKIYVITFTVQLIFSDSTSTDKIKEHIFNQLKPDILPNYNFNTFNQKRDFDALCKALFDKCKHEPVIIIMRELSSLADYKNQLLQAIYDFWNCIFQKMDTNSQELQSQSRIVLLLVVESEKQTEIFTKEKFNVILIEQEQDQNIKLSEDIKLNENLFLMPPLDKITKEDVKTWLETSSVIEYIPLSNHNRNIMVNTVIIGWGQETDNVIANICKQIFLLKGTAEIEPLWRIETIQ
jgi:class 3 adenylate cyclase